MKIRIIAFGKLKSSYLLSGIAEYKKRIANFIDIELIEIKESTIGQKDLNKSTKENYTALSKYISNNTYLLTEHGKEMTSLEFANFINKTINTHTSDFTFIIGPSYGFSRDFLKTFKNKISLSQLTFQHDIARLILFEQIYRGFTIINNHPYHQ